MTTTRRFARATTLAPALAAALLQLAPAAAAPIVGGTPTKVGDYPSVVALLIGQGLCTGTLIHPEWVLTAAHCVTPALVGVGSQAELTASVRVLFGTVSAFGGGTQVRAQATYPHPQFSVNALGAHDVGLIHLATPVTNVAPVAVNLVPGRAPVGIAVQMVGFGATGVQGQQPVGAGVERQVAQTSIACSGIDPSLSDANLLCFAQNAGKGKCEGDSGGPSFATIGGKLVEIGITSFGDQTCTAFGADTRTDAEKAFITQYVPGLECAKDADCDAGEICYASKCILMPFEPMGLGATCASNADCQSGQCGQGPDGMKCVEACAMGGTACPSGFSCLSTGGTGGGGVCWADAGAGGEDGGGCCDAGGHGAPTALLGALLGGLALRRRRR